MRAQPSMARCIAARSVISPCTTSAPSRRRAPARSSSRRTRARTLRPLASSIAVRLRPMAPTAPAAPVTRIGASYSDSAVILAPIIRLVARHRISGRGLVWRPDGGPDLAELTRDLAPGRAGILTDVHLTEQAERDNPVGIGGMCGEAPHRGIGLVG